MTALFIEAREIIRNAKAARATGAITAEQCREVILNTLQHVAEQFLHLAPA